MTTKALADYVFASKYARYLPQKQRRETYDEAVDRVIDMHRQTLGGGVEDLLQSVEKAMKDKLIVGSQRAFQFGGEPMLQKHARGYNCSYSPCDRPRFFQEALWLLLCGTGTGFSVQKHHVAKLPRINKPGDKVVTHVVGDSIEGWADAAGELMHSYFLEGRDTVEFDFSKVRPKGSPLSSGIGKAPGPSGLAKALENVRSVLDRCVGKALRPIDAYDCVMHLSDAVLSGGVRRSATIALFSSDDDQMAQAKTGDWFERNPQRGRSNNSAVLLRDDVSYDEYAALMSNVREFGEPGTFWANFLEGGTNPCCEIGLYADYNGASGWAFCNLSEINMARVHNIQDWERAATAAATIGTIQASYTRFEYLGEVSERIAKREALLGVSMTGMMENPALAFDTRLQTRMASVVKFVNEEVAKRIGINPAARLTCVKPSGTSSTILETCAGIHPHHSRRYLRRVQANRQEPLAQWFAEHNPRAVEKSVWGADDVVLTFCIQPATGAVIKGDMTAPEMLERVRLTQRHWVDAGKVPSRCADIRVSHNVSNTITVKDDEWEDVTTYIYDNRRAFAGVSFLADGGDLDYPQAPFVAVLTAEEIVGEYGVGAIMASGLIVDAPDGDLWTACRELAGDWGRRAKQFAARYFAGDVQRMTRCLKRVHTAKLWEDLQREWVDVDYAQCIELDDNTRATEDVACGGGKCEIL